jgi:KDO2-lipid IV(A) lauroyltransferase
MMNPGHDSPQGSDYRNRSFYRRLYTSRGFDLIVLGCRLLGDHCALLLSRAIGLGYALTHPSTVRAIRANMALLAPKSASFVSACRLLMNHAESLSLYGRLSLKEPAEVMQMLGEKKGFEHLKKAHEEGKGCLLVTGHLGFFELGGLVMTQLGFPMTALTIPEPSYELTRWRAKFRGRWGVKTIVVGDDSFSVLDITHALQNGDFVASLADRPYNGKGIPVELPHGKILFSTGPALISLLAGCPMIPVGVVGRSDGKFDIEAGPAISPHWLPVGRDETLAHYTRELASALLPLFLRNPEQWYHFSQLDYTLAQGGKAGNSTP